MNNIVPSVGTAVKNICDHRHLSRSEQRHYASGDNNDTPVMAPRPERLVLPIDAGCVSTANQFGPTRADYHDNYRKAGQDLGAAKNRQADVLGLLGELLVLHALREAGFAPSGHVVFSIPMPTGPDFRLNEHSFDVKTCRWTGRRQFVYINEQQRLDPKGHADYYLPIVMNGDGTAYLLRPIAAADLAAWPLREGHSPYRSCAVDSLPCVCSMEEAGKW